MPCSDGLALDRMEEERIRNKRRKLGMEDCIPNLPFEIVDREGKTIAAFSHAADADYYLLKMELYIPYLRRCRVVKCPC